MEDQEDEELIDQLMEEAMSEDCITCPDCGEIIEVDATECSCGWKNILVEEGLV